MPDTTIEFTGPQGDAAADYETYVRAYWCDDDRGYLGSGPSGGVTCSTVCIRCGHVNIQRNSAVRLCGKCGEVPR